MKIVFSSFLFLIPFWLCSQQISDTSYIPPIANKAYASAAGPVILIDEAHNNFHTKDGRYYAFANLLERDGYQVKANTEKFSPVQLNKGKILVISNALHESNLSSWDLPNPSAFSDSEIEIVQKWVKNGGNLFLIADHMPMAGAAKDLASAFGFEFSNGFVFHKTKQGPAFFSKKDNSLTDNIITRGRSDNESVQQIATFTGQAFKIPEGATPILVFDENYENKLPEKAWVFDEKTKVMDVNGWSQGAFKKYGNGHIVVFGEAAMFSAQLAGAEKFKMGMNHEFAPENYQLLLNIIHWLDGILN